MHKNLLQKIACTIVVLITVSVSRAAYGQKPLTELPNAPDTLIAEDAPSGVKDPIDNSNPSEQPSSTQQDQSPLATAKVPDDSGQETQTKRILGIIPNFRSVSADQHLPPQSIKEKFITASQDSFDFSSFIVPALLAGYDQARNKTPEFHQGAAGYGRYFWHSFVDQTSENYFVEFIVPAIAHEDTRYYTLGHGGFRKRSVYALKHIVVTRNDAGKNVFNAGEIFGSGISAGLSNAYYPSAERNFSNTAEQWGSSVGIDAFSFVLREFWPDINHRLFHGKK